MRGVSIATTAGVHEAVRLRRQSLSTGGEAIAFDGGEGTLENNLATVCQDLPSLSKSCQDFVRS